MLSLWCVVQQNDVTKTATQFTSCTIHEVLSYQHSFTNHILYNPCSNVLPIQLHKSHSVQSMQYFLTNTASQITSCTIHAVLSHQYSFTNHILYNPCSTVLPIQLHKSHSVQSMQYSLTNTASEFTSCVIHEVPCYQDSFTNYILYNSYSTMLTIQFHNSHPVQSMQYRVTNVTPLA